MQENSACSILEHTASDGGNGLLYREDGTKRIAGNALVALTLMIAESGPSERDIIVNLAANLINKNN